MSLRVCRSLLAILLLAAPVACKHADESVRKRGPIPRPNANAVEGATTNPTSRPAVEATWQSTPLPLRSEPVAVKKGPAPLVYMTEGPGVFRLVDATTGEALADAFAKGQTIIRVTERYGVVYGSETMWNGPLAKGHEYALYLLPDGTNVARQGVSRPKAK